MVKCTLTEQCLCRTLRNTFLDNVFPATCHAINQMKTFYSCLNVTFNFAKVTAEKRRFGRVKDLASTFTKAHQVQHLGYKENFVFWEINSEVSQYIINVFFHYCNILELNAL